MEEFPSVGKWAEHKLDLLRKYLEAYAKIMHKQVEKWLQGGFHYIDAFAGSGYAKSKTDEKYLIDLIEGSPLRALNIEPSFSRYHFIEISSERIGLLEHLKRDFPGKSIEIYEGDANSVIRVKIVPWLQSIGKPVRAFIFLDPYGLQVEWETIEFLGSLKRTVQVDIFINFPLMGIQRAALPKKRRPDESQVALLQKVIGGEKVEQVVDEVYAEKLTLFPEVKAIEKLKRGAQWFADLYRDRLTSVFPCVSNAVIMRNSKNAPLYALMLASHEKVAIKIMNDIFKKYQYDRLTAWRG